MRGRILAIVIATLGMMVPTTVDAPAATCTDAPCGVPSCWDLSPRVRPDMPRKLLLHCWNTTGAKVLAQPAHGQITDVSTDWYGVHFTMHAAADAPRWDTARFEVQGYNGPIEIDVPIEVVPTEENSAPYCYGDKVSQRSDGQGPVDLFVHPSCHDPDEDEFVMNGTGPGIHLDAPKQVPAGQGEANWHYRTATHNGSETAQVFATDVLGARSTDATLDITVGPNIDRLPGCMPGSAYFDGSGVFPIHSRAGQIRRVGIICSDPDGDVFATLPSDLPDRGALTAVPGEPQVSTVWGYEQWHDTTYVPTDSTYEPDEFTLTSSGARGSADQRFRIIPRALPENGGGWCGWSGGEIVPNTAGKVELWCGDDDGDPLSAELVSEPLHGEAGIPIVTPGLYGNQTIAIPYVPEPGYKGYDCIKVSIIDGNGLAFEISIDIWVREPYAPPIPDPIPLPYPPPLPPLPLPLPAPTPLSKSTAERMVKDYVQQALGTNSVKQVPAPGSAQVWAPAKLSRKALLKSGSAPAMIVLCPAGCTFKSDAELFTGSRTRARASRRSVSQTVAAGASQLIHLTLDADDRRPLKRAKKPRADFRVAVRAPGAARRSFKRSIRIDR